MRKSLRAKINTFGRLKQYFLRGHSQWFALGMTLLNFTLIFYNFLWKNLMFIPSDFKHFSIFFITFGLFYFPIAAFFGWQDFKRGTFKAEALLIKEVSPIWRELFVRLDRIEEKLKDRIP